MNKYRSFFCALLLLVGATPVLRAAPLSRLQTSGTDWINERGERVILKGCNLGNWLLLEMWMLDLHDQFTDQYRFIQNLETRFGAEQAHAWMEQYRQAYITPADFHALSGFGFNTVRIPFHYSLIADPDDPHRFFWLDRAVEWAREAGLYVILDMHGAPGGQSVDHTTGHAGQNRLWTDASCRAEFLQLWRDLALRYHDHPGVAGYDLINEPFGDYQTAAHLNPLVEIMDAGIRAIREVDPHTIIILSGPQQGIDLYGPPADRGWTQVAYSEHYYPALHGQKEVLETHARFIHRHLPWREERLRAYQVPFLVGEFNGVLNRLAGPEMSRKYFDVYAEKGWAATLWTYKLLQRRGGQPEDRWYLVKNAADLTLPNFRHAPREVINKWFDDLNDMPMVTNQTARTAFTTDDLAPPALHPWPARITRPSKNEPIQDWTSTAVGDALPGGQYLDSEGRLHLFGGGRDVYGTQDQLQFLCQPIGETTVLSARLIRLFDSHPFAKAGLMIRENSEPDAAMAFLHLFPDGLLVFAHRDRAGREMQEHKMIVTGYPTHLRLEKTGDLITAAWSSNGQDWHQTTRTRIKGLKGRGLAGPAVLAHDDNLALTEAVFDEISFHTEETP